MFMLLTLFAFPGGAMADQVEDISGTEQQLQSIEAGATDPRSEPAPQYVAPPAELPVAEVVKPAPEAAPVPVEVKPAPEAVPAAEEVKPVPETVPAAEEVERAPETVPQAVPEKGATGRTASPVANAPAGTQKPADAPPSSMWRSFLSLFGLHDDRPSIPPVEIRNAAVPLGQDYIVGPGDLLGISVWRDDSLTRSVVVLPDGKIQFPLIGEIVAGGRTVAQLKQEFGEKLSRFVVDADISVEVKQSNSLFIYIIGKVNSPGRQMLVADTTVLQALAMAGGLNTFAEKDDVKIFRQEKERTLVYTFRYSQVVAGNRLGDNLLLQRGDVIVVP
jgi:polysaccharide export outer membrane protein